MQTKPKIILAALLLPSFSLFLPCTVAITGTRFASRSRRHDSQNIIRNKVFHFSAPSDSNDDRVNHSQLLEHKQYSKTKILKRIRGGDIASSSSSSCKVGLLIEAMTIFGTVVFAFSGALKAGRKGMDIIGMMIIASITAMGGGTMRDILMMGGGDEHVVFWMKTPMYLEISLVTALITFYIWPQVEAKFGVETDSAIPICTSDALGLAAFCVVGVQAAIKRGLAPTVCVVSGLMTATFGGIIRDVVCGDQARIMYPHRTLYVLGPALGSLVYTVLDYLMNTHSWRLDSSSITMISFSVAFLVRVLSFNKSWRMPHWNVVKDQ